MLIETAEFGLAALILITAVVMVRIAAGPTIFDRLLAAGAIGTNAIALLTLTGVVFHRPDMFVDLALTYALLNFIGTVAAAKYLKHHSGEEEAGRS